MDQINTTQLNEDNIREQLESLLNETRQLNKDIRKTALLAKNIDIEISKLETSFKETEKELVSFEKNTVKEIDKVILELAS